MSLRRKSCTACFNGRRKCDLQSPVCGRCRRTQKSCRYIHYPPLTPELTDAIVNKTFFAADVSSGGPLSLEASTMPYSASMDHSLLSSLGNLGDLDPVLGRTPGDQWVLGRLRKCPQSFVTNLSTFFIHRDMQIGTMSPSLRSAFGACAASLHLNEHNRAQLFQNIDADMAQSLIAPTQCTLTEELARLQAIVLYQLIRLSSEDLRQRIIFESQEQLMGRLSWQLLQRYSEAVGFVPISRSWWVLGESIRRTALVSYTLYGMYSYHKHGACLDLPTVSSIPVSMDQTSWDMDDWQPSTNREEIRWADWISVWHEVPRSPYNDFDKLLMVCCAGLEAVEAIESVDETFAYLT